MNLIMSLNVSVNLAPFGVKVLCIEPGCFKTNITNPKIWAKNLKELWDRLPQNVKDDYGPDYLDYGEFFALCHLKVFRNCA